MQNRRFGALSSSADPQKLADTIEGGLKVLAGILAYFGLSAITPDVQSLGHQLAQLIPMAYAFWNVATVAFGLFRKILVFIYDKIAGPKTV